MVVWTSEAFAKISEVVNEAFLKTHNKKNLRQLTKADVSSLEQLKVDIFTSVPLLDTVTAGSIYKSLSSGQRAPSDFTSEMSKRNINTDAMNIESYRQNVIGLYIEMRSKER